MIDCIQTFGFLIRALILDQVEENEGDCFRPSSLLWNHIFLTEVHFTRSGQILHLGKWSNYFWKMSKAQKNRAEASSAMLNNDSYQWESSFGRQT